MNGSINFYLNFLIDISNLQLTCRLVIPPPSNTLSSCTPVQPSAYTFTIDPSLLKQPENPTSTSPPQTPTLKRRAQPVTSPDHFFAYIYVTIGSGSAGSKSKSKSVVRVFGPLRISFKTSYSVFVADLANTLHTPADRNHAIQN